jgi:flagellar basal body L-ring protein FlgH
MKHFAYVVAFALLSAGMAAAAPSPNPIHTHRLDSPEATAAPAPKPDRSIEREVETWNEPDRQLFYRRARKLGLKVIIGFSDKAPEAATLASPSLLEESLLRQDEMAKIDDLKDAEKALTRMRYASETYLAGLIGGGRCHVGVHVPAELMLTR